MEKVQVNKAMLDVLMDMQRQNDFEADNMVLLNPTLSQISNTLTRIKAKYLEKTQEQNITDWVNFINAYKDDKTAQRLFDITQDGSLSTPPKTQDDIYQKALSLYDLTEDNKVKLKQYIIAFYNLQKSWETAVRLRSGGKGKDNQYGTLAIVLGGVGITGLIASSVWMDHILSPDKVTTTTAKKVTEGRTETDTSKQTEASQSDVEIPEQPDAGTTRNMDTTGSSDAANTTANTNAAAPPTDTAKAADVIAQGDATSATDVAAEAVDASAATKASQANLQSGAGTLIAVCLLLILAALFVLYLYYKTEKEQENDGEDKNLKGNVLGDKVAPASQLLNFTDIIEKPQQSNIGDGKGITYTEGNSSRQTVADDISEKSEQEKSEQGL